NGGDGRRPSRPKVYKGNGGKPTKKRHFLPKNSVSIAKNSWSFENYSVSFGKYSVSFGKYSALFGK
ncbi:MAG: hypothetical protein J1E77_00585, partial [Prevotella sp.]|nr:hypothetical protein [Prevotella sp.]